MRRLLSSFLLAAALTAPASASATTLTPQLLLKAQATLPVTKRTDIGVFGTMLIVPGSDPLYFYYVGPGFQATDWWWSSFRLGLTIGLPAGESMPIISWWNAFGSPAGRLSLFLETEVYPATFDGTGAPIYYGFYSLDYAASKRVKIGLHGEQVNAGIAAGPHVGLKVTDHLDTDLGYYWDFADSHVLRVGLGTTF